MPERIPGLSGDDHMLRWYAHNPVHGQRANEDAVELEEVRLDAEGYWDTVDDDPSRPPSRCRCPSTPTVSPLRLVGPKRRVGSDRAGLAVLAPVARDPSTSCHGAVHSP